MIQAIVFTIIAVWLTWGIANVIWGIAQILLGIAYGIVAVVLYALASTLELIFPTSPSREGSI
jgi:hypothetical protein